MCIPMARGCEGQSFWNSGTNRDVAKFFGANIFVQIASRASAHGESLQGSVGANTIVQIATHASAHGESLQASVGAKASVQIVTLDRPSAQTNKHCANGLREHTIPREGTPWVRMLSQPVEL